MSPTVPLPPPRPNVPLWRRRSGIFAIVLLAFAMGSVIQAAGWAQTSNYALVRALSDGTAKIDRYSWETRDSAYYDGHYYSVKAPGMPAMAVPVYSLLTTVRADMLSREMAENAHEAGAYRWYRAGVPSDQYRNKILAAREIRSDIEDYTPLVWMLGLFVVVIPSLLLMFIVSGLAESVAGGFGTIAGIVTGAGTMILPFSTLFFSHVLAAMLAIATFWLLWHERQRRSSSEAMLAAAGLLAGFAVTTEYPLALAGAILGVYAISRGGWRDWPKLLRRGAIYSLGVIVGVLPLLAYNLLVFGSITHFSYADAIAVQGVTGHDVIGLNDGGFFGITTPSFGNAFDLLFSAKGLFIATPVLLLALAGLWRMWRHERAAEAYTIAAILLAYLIYNAGYWLPFGGGTPGPRFLIPVLPFLGVALAPGFKRFTSTGFALAVPSILTMVAATLTLPMIGNGDVGFWVHLVREGNFEQTVASAFGVDNTWWGLLPFLIPFAASMVLTVVATSPLRFARDAPIAVCAVVAWAVAASIVPHAPETVTPGPDHDFSPLIWTAAIAAIAGVAIGALFDRRPRRPGEKLIEPASATG